MAVLACLLALVLSSCTTPESGESVTETRGPTGVVPDNLDQFYGQSVTWGDCGPYVTTGTSKQAFGTPGVRCSRVKVPLDYAEPGGEAIEVGVLRKKAGGDRIGSLLINPGGPGVSGMESAAALLGSPAIEKLSQRFDIVGFDPRGVGASKPAVRCLTGEERDADRGDDIEVDGSPEGVAQQEAEEREFAERCTERTEHGEKMLANLGTREVVRDMDVLRSVLGDEKLTYLGYSYGTRIGYTYAEAFPDNVRALLLDGAMDPEEDMVASMVAQGKGFGEAFDEFVAWCAEREDCALGDDPDKATKAYQDLARPLIERPVGLSDGRKLSFEDLSTATVQALYSQSLWERLNSGLNELTRQRGEQLVALADMYNERDPDGTYSTTQDAFVAIRCVDDPQVTDKQEIREAQRKFAKVAPFLDSGEPPSHARDACAFWPAENTSEPHLPDVKGVPPVLVISTTKDPATPYQAGVQLAKAMSGRLLTFEGTQHTVFGHGHACIDDAGVAYLIDQKLPDDGKRCS
ncbi:MAG: alpha/beta fold hydrolase [Actinophytocola sp.]|nr:alpha/beta fold hydrolase [Actinophytocola sp.]